MKKRLCFKSILMSLLMLPFFAFAIFKLLDINFLKDKTSYAQPNDVAVAASTDLQVTDKSSLDDALNQLNESLSESPVTINFNLNFDDSGDFPEKTIILSAGHATFTGTITSNSPEPIFKFSPTSSDNEFVLNLELKSTASENKDKAILFENDANTFETNIKLGEKLKTDYNNLCNYTRWVNLSVVSGSNFSTDTPLRIVYPYNLGRLIVIQNYSDRLADVIKVVPEDENLYSIKNNVNNGSLSSEAEINIKFVNNNGTENVDVKTFRYNDAFYTFPTLEGYEYAHHNCGGWFAKITLDKTYYVEHTTESVNALLANETTNLKTDLSKVDKANGFSVYSINQDELCKKVVDYFLEKGEVPTFELMWEDNVYSVSFDAGDGKFEGGEQALTSSGIFGDEITYPNAPNRYGYDFGGWVDEHEIEFEQNAHPTFDDNHTLHAVWTAKRYSIDFYSDPETLITTVDFTFGDEIDYPTGLEKVGYTFSGEWLTESQEVFDDTTMLDDYTKDHDNITKISLFAKWNINKYKLNLWYEDTLIDSIDFDYYTQITADMLTKPNDMVGYVFDQYYMDTEFNTPFAPFILSRNTSLYARYNLIYSKVYFCLGYDDKQITYDVGYGRSLPFLMNLTRPNFKFVGWFTDEALTNPFVNGTLMGTEDVYVYAKWQAKQQLQVDTSSRSFTVNDLTAAFDNFSTLDGFTVEYLVNGEWNRWAPVSVGTYDVRITRAEDDEYASFEVVLENALVIVPQYLNMTWLIAVLLIVFVVELLVCVLLKVMKKLKTNLSLSVAFLPFLSMYFDKQNGDLFVSSTQAITLTQFILIIASAVLVLVGFVLMIIFIYRLHRTTPALIYENVHDESEGLGETSQNAPKDTANDEKIKDKIDSYLSGFVTNKDGYVNKPDDNFDENTSGDYNVPLGTDENFVDEQDSNNNFQDKQDE